MCNLDQIIDKIVPSQHNFGTVIHHYLEYRQQHDEPNNIHGFRGWIIDNDNIGINAENAAVAHSYPLGASQCNIINLSLNQLENLVNHPEGFYSGQFLSSLIPDNINDAPTTMKCAFVVGLCNRHQPLTGTQFTQKVLNLGWTEQPNPAQAIRSVGNSVLRHFNLADDEMIPNGRFSLLFGC